MRETRDTTDIRQVRTTTPAPIDPALLQRVLEPLETARTLPGEAYASPEVFAWERRHFLEGSWACVGRATDLSRPGDQRAIQVGSIGVLLLRGAVGALRGFFNVCRHRGHELMETGAARNARGLKCPYHGWVYGLEGECRATPRFDADDLDPAEFPLVPVAVEDRWGWLFVNVSGDAGPIDEHLGNLWMAVADYSPERLVEAARHEYEIAANWKIVIENYLECYHCSSIHPELCKVTPPEAWIQYPEESSGVWIGGGMPLRDHAATMSLTGESFGVPIPSVPEARLREVGYIAMLPNLLISPHPDYLMTHRLVPLSEARTWIECTWLFPPEALERPGFSPDYAAEFWDITNWEDWRACESVQRNVSSPGFRQGPISPWEGDVWEEMRLIARGYAEGRLSPPRRSPSADG
jgi:glycine betaine catabolism A